MGERGPKPAPTKLKLLQGTRESRINRDEPMPTEGDIKPPAGMSRAAKKIWNELAPDLIDKGCLTPWDIYAFEAFCESVAHYRECRDLLHTHESGHGKYIDRGGGGGLIKSPYHQMMRDHIETMTKLGGRFGLTPGDRAGLVIGEKKPQHGAERYFGG